MGHWTCGNIYLMMSWCCDRNGYTVCFSKYIWFECILGVRLMHIPSMWGQGQAVWRFLPPKFTQGGTGVPKCKRCPKMQEVSSAGRCVSLGYNCYSEAGKGSFLLITQSSQYIPTSLTKCPVEWCFCRWKISGIIEIPTSQQRIEKI